MNAAFARLIGVLALAIAGSSRASTHYYVDASRSDDLGAGTNWATAKKVIQSAIDLTLAGDTVFVTNGDYSTGGLTNYPTGSILTTRVALVSAITVRSVNGPAVTRIVGTRDGDGCGPAAVRGAYLANNAALIGFTITNGATLDVNDTKNGINGGGAFLNGVSAYVSNCVFLDNRSFSYGAGLYGGKAYGCTFAHNRGSGGGAAASAVLYACTTVWNYASSGPGSNIGGGGLFISTAYDSLIASNTANGDGGGTHRTDLSNCVVIANSATNATSDGGGVARGTIRNCLVADNYAGEIGGGMSGISWPCLAYNTTFSRNRSGSYAGAFYNGTLYNCTLVGNQTAGTGGGLMTSTAYNTLIAGNEAGSVGGGAYGSTLLNCTVVFNRARGTSWRPGGGGIHDCISSNSIVYFNEAPPDTATNILCYGVTNIAYSCSTPLPPGDFNIEDNPLFVEPGDGYGTNHVAGHYPLRGRSRCVDAALLFPWMLPGDGAGRDRDLNGKPRVRGSQPDIGAYECIPDGTVISIR